MISGARTAEEANRGNGLATRRVKGSDGGVPRDREDSIKPVLVKKGQTLIDGRDDKIVGLYAAGPSANANLEDLYGLRVSPDLIRRVTDAVLDECREWPYRALDRMYASPNMGCLRSVITGMARS